MKNILIIINNKKKYIFKLNIKENNKIKIGNNIFFFKKLNIK